MVKKIVCLVIIEILLLKKRRKNAELKKEKEKRGAYFTATFSVSIGKRKTTFITRE